MNNKKLIITTVLSALLIAGSSAFADSNDLLRMDVKKAASDDTVDVTFYTTGGATNSVVSRKSGNTYVVLLPNVAGNQSVVPALGGVKDLVSNVSVKNVDDGIGGYTKVTFNTTKPVKIQTYTKKTAPLTKAQQDYKNLIAQNSKYDPDKKMENFKKTSTATPTVAAKPAVATKPATTTTQQAAKPAATTPTKTTTTKPAATTKPTSTPVKTAQTAKTPQVKQAAPVNSTTVAKPTAEEKPVDIIRVDSKPIPENQQKELKPYNPESLVEEQTVLEPVQGSETDIAQTEQNIQPKKDAKKLAQERKGLPIMPIAGALSVIGIFILGLLMNVIAKIAANNPKKIKEYLGSSTEDKNPIPEREIPQEAIQRERMNWQERYKLYSESLDSANNDKAAYVASMSGKKGALVNDVRARVSQMEHSYHHIPSIPSIPSKKIKHEVQSEDNAITDKMSEVGLKSFAKNINLKETSRHNLEPETIKVVTDPAKERKFVKLKNPELSVSRRNIGGHDFSISDLVRTGKRFLPKNSVSDILNNEQEQYLLSSIAEYFDVLNDETSYEKSDSTQEITNLMTNRAADMAGVTNPLSSDKQYMSKQTNPSKNGVNVKSKYDIDGDKSIFMVDFNGVSAIIGKIGENVFVLKKFDKIINKPMQVRLDYGSVYIVRVGGFKCLVDVAEERMGTLLEI